MSYSCSDFTDDILNALNVVVPDESDDDPSAQADLAMAEIERLQSMAVPGVQSVLAVFDAFVAMPDDPSRAPEHMTGMRVSFGELRAVKTALAGALFPSVAPSPGVLQSLKDLRGELDLIKGHWTEGLDNFAQQADAAIAAAEFPPLAPALATVFILQAEHFNVPGRTIKVHASQASAAVEAAKLVNLLLDAVELPRDATPATWEADLLRARTKRAEDHGCELDELGEDDGDVWLEELPVIATPAAV